MKVVTWNVNGIRAREAQLHQLLSAEAPDVLCLQEIKAAPDQIPDSLVQLPDYHSLWHGERAYSGVSLHLRREAFPEPPAFAHPPFDFETRAVVAEAGGSCFASLYVPNGGKDFEAKMRFLAALEAWVAEKRSAGLSLVLCGDYNVTREERDVHPKERKPGAIGQRPDEREAFARLLAGGLHDVGRELDPANEELYTWWAPWRNLRARNIGWRLDYVLASEDLARRASSCRSLRETGTSDHGPVVAVFG